MIKPILSEKKPIYFVTGATGFLGGRLAEILLKNGFPVVAFGRNEKRGAELNALGAQFICGDLRDVDKLSEAIPIQARIVHCAALCSTWGNYNDFYQANVVATRNLITVALQKQAQRLIHISTPSIYVEKKNRIDIKESDPIPTRMMNHYATTKYLAEKEVTSAVSNSGLKAVILRPQGIFGPGDPTLMPRVLRLAKKGILPVIGQGTAQIDLTYIDNVVDAILNAFESTNICLGKAYNISNGEPIELVQTLTKILKELDIPVRKKKIPFAAAWTIASAFETTYTLGQLQKEPPLTRYSVCTLGMTRTLDISSARTDLNYSPKISMKEGIQRYVEWYRQFES